MKETLAIFWLAILTITMVVANPEGFAAEPTGTIVVEVVGFEVETGTVQVALWDDPEGYPGDGEPLSGVSGPITNGRSEVRFEAVVYGDYAISLYQDVNGNGELDTRFMGIPKEPIGASNDAKGRFGPPKYKDARFTLDQPELRLTVTLQGL